MTRQEAIQWIHANPQSPVLRPCGYTGMAPQVLAITYTYRGRIHHSLVERIGDDFYEVVASLNQGTPLFRRNGNYYSSESELERALHRILSKDEDPSPDELSLDPC